MDYMFFKKLWSTIFDLNFEVLFKNILSVFHVNCIWFNT